jgi:hypothetical protein
MLAISEMRPRIERPLADARGFDLSRDRKGAIFRKYEGVPPTDFHDLPASLTRTVFDSSVTSIEYW